MLHVVIYLRAAAFNRCLLPLLHILTLYLYLFCLPVTDLQFSQTLLGRPVPFATAGDCYSAARCPQVGEILYIVGTEKCLVCPFCAICLLVV